MSLIKCNPEEYQVEVENDLKYYECIRAYQCEACDDKFAEIGKRVGYKIKKKCPSCKKMALDTYTVGNISFFVKDVTTLGQLAEKDNKKLGKYGVEDKIRALENSKKEAQDEAIRRYNQAGRDTSKIVDKKKENKTWFNPNGDDLSHLADLTDKGQQKYIETGVVDKNA